MAAQNGHADVAKLLMGAGAYRDKAKNDGQTPLSKAKQKGHTEIVKLLKTENRES